MKKNIPWKALPSFFLLIMIFGCATAQRGKETASADDYGVITGIKVQDDGLAITSNKNFVYTIYNANDPYKITVDIPDMRIGDFKDKIVSDKGSVTEIIPRQIDSPKPAVKIDLTLQTPSSVTPLYKDNTLTLVLKRDESSGAEEQKAVEPEEVAIVPDTSSGVSVAEKSAIEEHALDNTKAISDEKKPESVSASRPKATEISGIDIKKAEDSVKVVITGNGEMMPNVFPIDKRIVVDIPGVSFHAQLPRGTMFPLAAIRAGKYKDKIRLVLDLQEKTSYDVDAKGNTIEISLKRKEVALAESTSGSSPIEAATQKVTPQEAASKEATSIAATQQEPAPKEATSIAAAHKEAPKEIASVNVTSKEAVGKYKGKKISLDFQDADVGPIFRLLADVNGYNLILDPSVKGKITIKLLNVPWDQALDIILNTFNYGSRIDGNILWIAPVSVFTKISDDNAKAKEVEEKAEDLMQEVVRVNYATAAKLSTAITQGKLLSQRGSVTIDDRMNTLIIKDTQNSINKIKQLVRIMDVSKPQVMIEAKLVQVSSDYSQTLGINWGGSFSAPVFPNIASGTFSVNTPTLPAGPAATVGGGALNMTVGNANSVNVNLSLQALETVNKAKTLSNPKVLTMDNEKAVIQQGTTFFIPTVSQAGTQSQAVTATLSLTVTPKITPDGYVQLLVEATDNSLEVGTQGATAVVDTKSLTTQALVKDGETLVLGGIYKTTYTEIWNRVPLLADIPILGWLFKTRNILGPTVTELLIFITPTVVSKPL
jgi:type IV pilus assembly protein PilQ